MIRPIEMQMILPRSESVGNMQQNEIQHITNVNTNAANEAVKNEQKLSETVVEKDEKQFDTFQYDAKEEGNGTYKKQKRRSGRQQKQEKQASLAIDDFDNEKEETDIQPRINFQI